MLEYRFAPRNGEDGSQPRRISVNGKLATLGDRVEPSDKIRVDGHPLKHAPTTAPACRVLMYNKPEGELCSRKDPEGQGHCI